jgi:phosphoglycolate phosphatase-like HAD superfamily hydrolase
MIGLQASIETVTARRSAVSAPRWDFPLRIKAVLLDLDGTIMPSYKTLGAIQYIDEQLASRRGKASSFIDHCLTQHEFHTLLHKPLSARRAAIDYATDNDIKISAAVLRTMSGLQEQSFCLYDGFRAMLDQARRNGTFIGIYTNSSCECAVHRMHGSLLLPDAVHAVWARNGGSDLIDPAADRVLVPDYSQVLIPYTYRKPNDTPLREMAMLGDVGPNEILFIGEGINDLEVVYRDWSNPRAIFCFQERGAADICVKTAALNARLRPGNIPLGAGAVNSMIERRGIERDIIRLGNGFIDLLDLIDRGQISFVAPCRVPVVRNGRLDLDPHSPAAPVTARTPCTATIAYDGC